MANYRLILEATCLIVLLINTALYAEAAEKYCDEDFHMAVYRTCTEHKRSGRSAFSLNDFFRSNSKRTAGSPRQDDDFFLTMQKRPETYVGMGSYCCLVGCTRDQLSQVC
ncbi:gonad-stimulating substance-like [Asterias amurensis]|uniref:Relaxin-like gonad-stimulating peptide n=3 Tax=Asteroidea TaxID=7588 RepID=A0A140KFG4_ASTPO|nr:relaxin-like gonad-stimulating peptide [Asterias amurensis]BAU68091.1 relaxin-like gonad-stimulating peptide [Astropecten polyacanthus]